MWKQSDPNLKCVEEDLEERLISSNPTDFIKVLTPLDAFHRQKVVPRVKWLNQSHERAVAFAEVLGSKRPSLRIVDHLIVQYARDNTILVAGESGVPADLWSWYRRLLHANGKKYFDVFKRTNLLHIKVFDQDIEATIGQVLFFQWFIECDLPTYLKTNFDLIKTHMKDMEMKTTTNENKKKSRAASRPECVKPIPISYIGKFEMSFD